MPGHHSIQALTRLFLADGLAGLGLLLSGCLEGGSSSGDLDLSRAPEVEGSRVAVIHGFGDLVCFAGQRFPPARISGKLCRVIKHREQVSWN